MTTLQELRTTHHLLRDAVLRSGGTVAESAVHTHVPQPVRNPFASAVAVEHDPIRSIELGEPTRPPAAVAFLDGIQRYGAVGWIGLTPIVRGYVAAAVLTRRKGDALACSALAEEEFIVVPIQRLPDRARHELEALSLTLYDSPDSEVPHPVLDVQLAAQVVERRREVVESRAVTQYLAKAPGGWLVVDGSIGAYKAQTDHAHLLGLIKTHDTQYLTGSDLHTALMLPPGSRTSVFARTAGEERAAVTWYLRLWPWEGHDVLHGLVRLERPPSDDAIAEATEVSRWILSERAPLAGRDGRWDRLIYPIHQVEEYLRARVGEWR